MTALKVLRTLEGAKWEGKADKEDGSAVGHRNEQTFQDAVLAQHTESCVRAALMAVREAIAAGKKPEKTYSPIRITTDANGKRRKTTTSDPQFDYGSLIKSKDSAWPPGVDCEDLDGFQALSDYFRGVPAYWSYLSAEDHFQGSSYADWPERWFTIGVQKFVSSLLDRHIHVSGWDFDAKTFESIYVLREREVRALVPGASPLTVDVLVPLYGITFDEDVSSSPGLKSDPCIEALDDSQLAACWPSQRISDAESDLLLSATHAWVRPSVNVHKQPVSGWLIPSDLAFDELDRVLEVAAVSTHRPFGTKHVLYRPNGWAENWTGHLPAGGSWTWTVDRLANGIDQFGVAAEPAVLPEEMFVRRFRNLSHGSHELHLAARRLLGALLRHDPIDAVIDACIGIEALVGDSSPNEITYKLAIRSAALLAQAGYEDTVGIFNSVKSLYARRSKIVHGKLKPGDENSVKALGGRFSANSVGTVLLSALLAVVLDDPSLTERVSNDDLVLSQLKRVDSTHSQPAADN